MKVFVCDISALTYWRSVSEPPGKKTRIRRPFDTPRTRSDLGAIPGLGGFLRLGSAGRNKPLHLMVSRSDQRLMSHDFVFHVHSSDLPVNSFMEVGPDVYVASPELVFIQVCRALSLIEAVALGYELCGTYRVRSEGMVSARKLMTKESLGALAQQRCRPFGAVKARGFSRFIVEDSASPMESRVAMRLSLPRRLGGFGLPAPQMNRSIDLPGELADSLGRRYLKCDLMWPDRMVAVEYDSDRFHTGSDRIAFDAQRRNALSRAGVQLLTLTREQYRSSQGFSAFVRTLCSKLGLRFREPAVAFDRTKFGC